MRGYSLNPPICLLSSILNIHTHDGPLDHATQRLVFSPRRPLDLFFHVREIDITQMVQFSVREQLCKLWNLVNLYESGIQSSKNLSIIKPYTF